MQPDHRKKVRLFSFFSLSFVSLWRLTIFLFVFFFLFNYGEKWKSMKKNVFLEIRLFLFNCFSPVRHSCSNSVVYMNWDVLGLVEKLKTVWCVDYAIFWWLIEIIGWTCDDEWFWVWSLTLWSVITSNLWLNSINAIFFFLLNVYTLLFFFSLFFFFFQFSQVFPFHMDFSFPLIVISVTAIRRWVNSYTPSIPLRYTSTK